MFLEGESPTLKYKKEKQKIVVKVVKVVSFTTDQ